MQLSDSFWAMADRFMHFIEEITDCPMIICNDKGVIVKASVRSRVGTPHAGAQKILRGECGDYFVTAEEAARNTLVKEGWNTPIVIDGKRVGTFGIAGKLELTRPLAKIAALVLSGWIRQMEQQNKLQQTSEEVFGLINRLTRQIDDASATATDTTEKMSEAAERTADKLKTTDGILHHVHRIAQQSHILSVNGAVEAARAGEQGRAFSVVVEEMGHLAISTRETADQIQRTLDEIREAMLVMNTSIDISVQNTQKQIGMMLEVVRGVDSLKEHILALKASFEQ